jgi:hypothetical protein
MCDKYISTVTQNNVTIKVLQIKTYMWTFQLDPEQQERRTIYHPS